MPYTIVEYHAEHERYRCGYCKSDDTNYSHGMWAHLMTVSDYQDLIDRGWRRSGKYCYKPTMNVTCCPMYTIRCTATDFQTSKSQKKIIKKVNKFVTQELENHCGESSSSMLIDGGDENEEQNEIGTSDAHMAASGLSKTKANLDISQIRPFLLKNSLEQQAGSSVTVETSTEQTSHTEARKVKPGNGPDPVRAPAKKAKELRLERKQEKLRQKGIEPSTIFKINKNKEKSVEEFLEDLPQQFSDRLKLKLVRTNPHSPEWEATKAESHRVYTKYQMEIHGDSESKCTFKQFEGFLVDSPLQQNFASDGPDCGYGSFHQQYWLDGKLIAVGVIDILPRCISSVYFYYDPDYSQLTLGTYGALREIALTRKLQAKTPNLRYYYMGFYVHSCQKMRYKGNYKPSFLLCPETYNWFPIKEAIQKIDQRPYSRLDPAIDALDTNLCNERDLDGIPLLIGHNIMSYDVVKNNTKSTSGRRSNLPNVEPSYLLEYATLAGKKCAKRMLLVIDD